MTYLDEIAERIRDEIPPDARPDEDALDLFRLYALLALSKGAATSLADVHDAWVAWMLVRGRTHSSMVPFEDLPADVQAEDAPFADAIRRVAPALER